ncbi:hypothetical protein ACT009_09825 [Sphingomonas sp. Tas61C01]|uniref:hypothetical protein n=1 Tax=Sphingomonas sp. Tas61C01 TaxID=3458297 RepID=UPI00403EE55D
MIRAAAALALAAVAPSAAVSLPPPPSPAAAITRARMPGFAAVLIDRPLAIGTSAWPRIAEAAAWRANLVGGAAARQSSRWTYALSLIGARRGSDALGAIEVMATDDPDLTLVPAWRRARGAALTLLRRPDDAIAALADDRLIGDPEACLWRMRALAEAGLGAAALAHLRCAMPALYARAPADRHPFLLAAGSAAVAAGRYCPALAWLNALPPGDVAANLLRGVATTALGDRQGGRMLLDRVVLRGDPEQRAAARLALIEGAVAANAIAPAAALQQLDSLRFGWRGGEVERRALWLSMRLADRIGDAPAALAAGGVLFRYYQNGTETGNLTAMLQFQLNRALSPGTSVSLAQGAGLFWAYRDLMPSGVEGDRLVEMLASRLQAVGLYGRAADLLQYRMTARAEDIEQGPLSIRVASLFILAGKPDKAIDALRRTDAPAYPPAMRADRRRIEAVALDLLGKPDEALATIQDVAGSDALRAEIRWRARDWAGYAATAPALPRGDTLDEVAQAVILRHAIALAMLGREDALAQLNVRYARSFATLPSAATFAMLTDRIGAIDPAALGDALASLPSASPAGEIGDLIAAGDAAQERKPG